MMYPVVPACWLWIAGLLLQFLGVQGGGLLGSSRGCNGGRSSSFAGLLPFRTGDIYNDAGLPAHYLTVYLGVVSEVCSLCISSCSLAGRSAYGVYGKGVLFSGS